jgi:hypothetical protein
MSTERPANQRATYYPINSDVPRSNKDADDETTYVAADVFTLGTLGTLDGDILNAASFEIPTTPPVSSDVEELITNILNSADEEIEEEESVWHECTPHSRVILEVNSVDGYIDLHKRVNNLKKTMTQLLHKDDFDDIRDVWCTQGSCIDETNSADDEDEYEYISEASWDSMFI